MQVRRILLQTDHLSPNARPHNLPALHYPSLFARTQSSASQIEAHISKLGWQPAWRYGMYKQAHYHSSTHELLAVFRGNAEILLGGSDELASSVAASGGNDEVKEGEGEAHKVIKLEMGDALLLPAGYSHRALRDSDGFQMVGSYPDGAAQWDSESTTAFHSCWRKLTVLDSPCGATVCYPDKTKVDKSTEVIEKLVQSQRKGLLRAQDPAKGLVDDAEDAIQKYWLDA